MSSNVEENMDSNKKKKNRPKLRLKIFKRKDASFKKIHEELYGQDGSVKIKENSVKDPPEESTEGVTTRDNRTDSDTSEETAPRVAAVTKGRRRSLSACADVLDTRIKIITKDQDEKDGKTEEDADQLSPLPCSPCFSPQRSCLRARSATIGYEGEVVQTISRPRSVSFSPETVDPPPRNMKYRAWIEARSKPPPVNVKHEKHKQKMSQLKKVNMSDYLVSRKMTSTGILGSSTAAFGGGGMMM